MRLKLHISPCPNDTFMFDALVNQHIDSLGLEFDTIYHDIEELNRDAYNDLPDIGKVSCAILPQITDRYEILNSGAALGRGNGPLLVQRKGHTGPIRQIVVPGLHTTANLLMKKLFPEITQKTPLLFSEITRAVAHGEYDAGVLIHEGRFVYAAQGLELVADLGQLWEQRTGLPLSLGAIVIRRTLPKTVKKQIGELVKHSIEYAHQHPAASRSFIKSHAQEMDDAVIDAHIALFVNEYSQSLGLTGRKAIETLTGQKI